MKGVLQLFSGPDSKPEIKENEAAQFFLLTPNPNELRDLWQVYLISLGSADERKKLITFLQAISPQYKLWSRGNFSPIDIGALNQGHKLFPSRLSNTLPKWDAKLGKHVSDRLRAYLSKIQSEELEPPSLISDGDIDEADGPYVKFKRQEIPETYQPTKGSEFAYLLCLYLQSPHTLQHVLGVTDSINVTLKIIQRSVLQFESLKKLISIGIAQKIRVSANPELPNGAEILQANKIYLDWCFDAFHHFIWLIGMSITSFLACFRFLSAHTASPLLNLQIHEVLFTLFGDVAGDSRSKNRKRPLVAPGLSTPPPTPVARFMDEKLLHSNVILARKTRDELLQIGLLKLIKDLLAVDANFISDLTKGGVLVSGPDQPETMISSRIIKYDLILSTLIILSDILFLNRTCLATLGVITSEFPDAKAEANEVGFIRHLVQDIGWPSLQRRDYPSNVRRFRALGGMERMLDLVLWTTSTFDSSEEPSPEVSPYRSFREDSPPPKPSTVLISPDSTKDIRSPKPWDHRNSMLKLLFDVFFRITESEFVAWSKKGDQTPGTSPLVEQQNEARRAAPSDIYTLVPFILDLFNENIRQTANNKRVRVYIKEHHPELQLFVLDYFTQVMDTDPFFSTNLLKMDILDIILGEYFTYLPISEFTKKVVNFIALVNVIPKHRKLTEVLHEATILFLSYLFTRAEANSLELPKLIERIEASLDYLCRDISFSTPEFYYALFFVFHLSRVLYLAISNFPENATRSLDQLDICSKIVPVLNLVANLTNIIVPAMEDSINKLVHLEILKEAQEWLFCFTQIYLETPRGQRETKSRRSFVRSEGYYRALYCPELIDTFFKLLELPETRNFGLFQIANMMKVEISPKKLDLGLEKRNTIEPGISFERQKGPLLALYGKFLDYTVQLQQSAVKSKSDSSYRSKRELLIFLLDAGISEVIDNEGKKRSERQNNFRESNCFVMLLSLLHGDPTNEVERRELGELSVTVLRALTRLVMGNQDSKEDFSRAVGYDQLKKLLLHAFGDYLSRDTALSSELLDVMFDMLVDGNFDPRNYFLIQNKDIVLLLFKLAPLFPITVQMELFDTFTSILVNCPSNLATCCEAGLISELTWSIPGITRAICKEKNGSGVVRKKRAVLMREDEENDGERIDYSSANPVVVEEAANKDPTNEHRVLLDKVVHLIQVLARYSITVRELKQLLNLVKPKKTSLFIGNFISLQELLGPNLDDHAEDNHFLESKMLTTWTILRSVHHILAFQAEMRGEFFGKNSLGATAGPTPLLKRSTRGVPLWTFNFNGKSSQFIVGQLPVWPPAGGNYSFSTWINIESFESPSAICNFRPRLLSFLTPDNVGFELYFVDGFLHYHIRAGAGSELAEVQTFKFESFQFSPKKWYHLTLTFVNFSRLWSKSSEVKLYVNSIFYQKIAIRGQTQVFKNIACGRIGCGSRGSFRLENERSNRSGRNNGRPRFFSQKTPASADFGMDDLSKSASRSPGRRGSISDSRRVSLMDRTGTTLEIESKDPAEKFTFFGQMCAIYFFEEELQPKEIVEIFALGPTHYSDFRSSTVRDTEAEKTDDGLGIFDGVLTSRLICYYVCQSIEGNACFDNSPSSGADGLNAYVKDVQKLVQNDVNDIITCIGGISMIIPLFLHLNLPPDEIPGGSHANLALVLFDVVKFLLVNSTANQADFLKNSGFAVLGYSLVHVSPESLSVPLLDSVFELIMNNPQLPPLLVLQIIQYILLDFDLWVYTDLDVQRHLFEVVLPGVVCQYRRAMRTYLIGVQGLLDVIRTYYWDVFSRRFSKASAAPIHRLSERNADGCLPKEEIRRDIFQLICVLIGTDPTRAEFRSMIDFMLCMAGSDPKPCIELLAVFEEYFTISADVPVTNTASPEDSETAADAQFSKMGYAAALNFLRSDRATKWNFFEVSAMESAGGLDSYNKVLLNSKFDTLNVALLRVMVKYIGMLNVYELNSRSFKFFSGVSVKSISEYFEGFTFLYSVLKKMRFTPLLYSTLHGLMSAAEIPPTPIPAQRLDNQFMIKIPEVIPLIFRLSRFSGFKEKILQDFYTILTRYPENQQMVMEQCQGWQGWLALLNGFAPSIRNTPKNEGINPSGVFGPRVGPDPSINDSCNNYVVLIFSLFAFTSLQTNKQGYLQIHHMLSYIRSLNPANPSEFLPLSAIGSIDEPNSGNQSTPADSVPADVANSPSELLLLMVLENIMMSLKMEAEYLIQAPRPQGTESPSRSSVESESPRPGRSSLSYTSDYLLLDIKKKSSPLLNNLLFLFKMTDEVIFYPRGLALEPGIPTTELHHKLLSATIDVIYMCGLLRPAGVSVMKNATALSYDVLRSMFLRMCSAWFYHMDALDEITISQHISRCNKLLGLAFPMLPTLSNQPMQQVDQDGCFYVLYHLFRVAVKYEASGKISDLYECSSFVAFMRELLAYYAPVSLGQLKPTKDNPSPATPRERLSVSYYYAHLTNSRRTTEEFFQTLCDREVLDIVMPLLKERVKNKLTAEINNASNVNMKWNRGMQMAIKEFQDLETKLADLTQRKETQLSALDLKPPVNVPWSSSTRLDTPGGGERRISAKYQKEIRAQQARYWRRIVRMHLLIYGHGIIEDPYGLSDTAEHLMGSLKLPVFHYKLNPFENRSRMRLRVTRNRRFNDHKDALVYSRGGNLHKSEQPETQEVEEDVNEVINRLTELRAINTRNQGQSFATTETVKMLNLNSTNLETETLSDDEAETAGNEKEKEEKEKAIEKEKEKDNKGEQTLMKVGCTLITPTKATNGTLELTTTHLYFIEVRDEEPIEAEATSGFAKTSVTPATQKLNSSQKLNAFGEKKPLKTKTWPISVIREIHLRRYLLCPSALEIFIKNETNYFLNFPERVDRNRLYNMITNYHGSTITYLDKTSPSETLRKSGLTEAWQRGDISNFDYLMHLNTIAGRTFNDLTQYPVFPWILGEYEADCINLSDPANYRDLSKPMGAINEKRLKMYIERYNSWMDDTLPAFHYGSHYSSPHTVCYWLIRMEPFTSLSIELQDGRFDHADRLFHSIGNSWRNCTSAPADVKELIPEFFCNPCFLRNENNFDFGIKQNGVKLGDVVLPPWARNSADEFIRINRLALESDYVSENLHNWIDLIFGYKQRGDEAIEAHNVFHHLTYEGSVDFEAIEDPTRRAATEATIANFGQTPCQLLTKRHPARSAGGKFGSSDWSRATMFSPSRRTNLHNHKIIGVGNGNILSVLTVREGIDKEVPGQVLSIGGSMGMLVEASSILLPTVSN